MTSRDQVVVLMSGGLDSTVCAEMALREGRLAGCVFVDYGHPARQAEAWRAFAWAERNHTRLHVLHVLGLYLGDMDGTESDSPQIVANRNMVLIAGAANVAATWGAKSVWLGATRADAAEYADCRSDVLTPLAHALLSACGVVVAAPLIGKTRAEVAAMATEWGVDGTWSCYGAGPEPCGRCASCKQSPPTAPRAMWRCVW